MVCILCLTTPVYLFKKYRVLIIDDEGIKWQICHYNNKTIVHYFELIPLQTIYISVTSSPQMVLLRFKTAKLLYDLALNFFTQDQQDSIIEYLTTTFLNSGIIQ